MLRVQIRNFQSLAAVDLTIDGLTVLTGPNNSGKSGCIRAIRGVFQNSRNAKQLVRHGASQLDVLVDFGDRQVRWEKSDKVNRYTVDGQVLDKVGVGVPPEVAELGLQAVRVGDQTLWPQIADQFSGQVFLVDQPGSVMAEAISDTERVSRLNQAMRQSESDRRQVQQTLRVRQQDLKASEAKLLGFQGLEALLERIALLRNVHEGLQQKSKELGALQEILVRRKALQEQCRILREATQVSVPSPNQVAETRRALVLLNGWKTRHEGFRRTLTTLSASQGIQIPPAPAPMPDKDWLQRVVRRQTALQEVCKRLVGVDQVSWGPSPAAPPMNLVSWVPKLQVLRKQIARLAPASALTIPQGQGLAETRGQLTELSRWKSRQGDLQIQVVEKLAAVEECQRNLDQVNHEIHGAVADQCPVCGRAG